MSKISYLSLLIIFITNQCFTVLHAQNNKLEYLQNLTLSDGLSHNGVTDILEDSKGYLWVATFDGLNRYNGYEFKVFKNTLVNKQISSNRIRCLVEDENGNIWIGTEEGIDIYDYSTESFISIYNSDESSFNQNPIIRKIVFTSTGQAVCLTEREGIFIFDRNYNLLSKYYPATYSNQQLQFLDLAELDESNWLFTTNKGLFHFNITNKNFKSILNQGYRVSNSIKKSNDSTFILVESYGLLVLDVKKRNESFEFKPRPRLMKGESFNSLSIDKFKNLWLGTSNDGVLHVNNLDKFLGGLEVEKSGFNLENNILRTSCVLSNTSSGCWVGSFNEGIFQFPLSENPFNHITAEKNLPYGVTTNSILSLNMMSDDVVSVTANQGGEAFFNTITHEYEKLPFGYSTQRPFSSGPIYKDSRGDIWLSGGFNKNLFRYKYHQNQLKSVLNEADVFDLSATRVIQEDKEGNIWFGGNKNLFRLQVAKDGKRGKLESVNDCSEFKKKKIKNIRFIYDDPDYDFLWIGTEYDGLYRILLNGGDDDLCTMKINNYRTDGNNSSSISSNFVTSIIRVPGKDLWIGTERGGINKVLNSDQQPTFVSFSEKDGLSNNVVKNILCDDNKNLWITTNMGLNRFNTEDLWFQRIRKQDGLPFEEFEFAAQKLKNGYMVLAGQRGFCYFKPEDIETSDDLPPFQFGNIKIHNKIISIGDTINGRVLLNKRLNEVNTLELKHHENVLSLELNSLHYSNPDNYSIIYKLSPLNKNWVLIPTTQRYIDFNGLSSGKYELQVMVSNSLNQWSDPYKITIIIHPPFWKTPWAIAIYIIFLALIVISVIKVRGRVLQLKYNWEIEQLEKNKIKEVDEAKFKFFSNISHEFKTPLTLISGPIEMLMDKHKNDKESWTKLNLVKRQSKKMSQLVDQVHDFRKSDKNMLRLNFSVFNFQAFLKEILVDFKLMANDTGKEVGVKCSIPNVYIRADKDNLEKVFNNVFNNAFKFTTEGDFIRLNVSVNGNKLFIQIMDSGRGIDKVDLPHVFERFFQSKLNDRAYTGGSGIGLAFTKRLVEMHYGSIAIESELGHGTIVKIELPIVVDKQEYDAVISDIIKVEEAELQKQLQLKTSDEAKIVSSGDFADTTIFLAEDNDDMRLFIKSSLERHFKVTAFENGKKLIDRMEEEWPDIIISDVLMPEMNGFDLCSQVKSDIKTGHIPVVLLTACTSAEYQLKGLKTGADLYIKKPFELQHLITCIENVLQNRKLLRERYMGDFSIGLEKKPGNSSDNIFLEKLYKLLSENLDNSELELDNIAKELGLNRTHFYQKVKALTNETPFELIKSYRLRKAAEFLRHKQLPLAEVTARIGFKSTSHFSRAFKEKYGCSPSKYTAQQ
ncbi:hybrid sensor histidine kinase/response regulator transcription factor [Labilibacter marinus]|uniref:hybrid sensor histidine kinase/response regulator transcription factor n=1 Tax=Labilibacter marinus TaxID=1477105 RepID=UPI00095012FB|nr:two-component regulator propeller domain-containing protein [Labilibacter marinus]